MKKLILLFVTISTYVYCIAQQKDTTNYRRAEGEKIGINKIQDNRIMFLNAYNFDFGNTALSSNYVGHLNLFSPSLNRKNSESDDRIIMDDKSWGWGFNTGILKINYNQKDSSNRFQNFKENVFLSPFDELKDSVRFLRQINNYKVETKSTVWSFYVQPTFELTKSSNIQHIYLHAHAELLATKWSSTTTIVNINQAVDTAIFTKSAYPNVVIRGRLSNEVSSSTNILSGYFGVGATFDLEPWLRGSFFFQPTYGLTTNKPSLSSTDISSSIRLGSSRRESSSVFGKTWNPFYLVRAYYTHSIAKTPQKDGSTLVLGMDIRGLFPFYAPQYAAYIGLNVGLDSILDLIGGTTGKEKATVNPNTPASTPVVATIGRLH